MSQGRPIGRPASTMAQTTKPAAPSTMPCTVLRPICVNGQRREAGSTVELTPAQYAECAAAGKVGPLVESKPVKPARAAAKKPEPEETQS